MNLTVLYRMFFAPSHWFRMRHIKLLAGGKEFKRVSVERNHYLQHVSGRRLWQSLRPQDTDYYDPLSKQFFTTRRPQNFTMPSKTLSMQQTVHVYIRG